jgi:hypothetical protein
MARAPKSKAVRPLPTAIDSQPTAAVPPPVISDANAPILEARRYDVSSLVECVTAIRKIAHDNGVNTRDWWVDDETYRAFRERLAVWNFDVVPRLATWHRSEAGYFLLGLANKDDPLTSLRKPHLTMSLDSDNYKTTLDAMANTRICESCEFERQSPPDWIKFATERGLETVPDVLSLVAQSWRTEARIPTRTANALYKALGGMMLLCGYNNDTPIVTIVGDLACKGARLDRQSFAPHVKAARAAVTGTSNPAEARTK